MLTTSVTDPAAFDVLNAARIMGVGRSTVFEEIKTGRLEARKVGRKTLITRSAIENWLRSLPVRAVA
ncbi:helix-turn-helix domain-containing protein [Azorhizobium doebereinerae]|uniref:helix-turn-helix domain-containing protein n=1 Tax=Azorhizobium doebereinerae TaxID=281091 RepID=UPI000401D78C|nr:helix-turn-helix domain-containing protein [Azorhizobium doebereinerae]